MAVILTADALVALPDIEFFMNAKGRTIKIDTDADSLNTLINAMSDVIKRYCGTLLKSQSVVAELHRGTGTQILRLKNIWNISAVVVTNTDDDSVVDAGSYKVGDRGKLYLLTGTWKDPGYPLWSVDYTAGFTPIEESLKYACVKWIAKEWMATGAERIGMISKAVGDGASVTYDIKDIPNDIKLFLKDYRNRI